MKYKVKDKRWIKKQHPKCGREFYPAGYATHVQHCTGPGYKSGYKPKHTPDKEKLAKAVSSREDGRSALIPCSKGCGREVSKAGRHQHEKYCEGPGYTPGYSAKRRIERRMTTNPALKLRASEADNYYYAPINAVKMAYELFSEDFALGAAMCHIAACKMEESRDEILKHLTQARDMISLKIQDLQG